jgi:hypothetical protein
MDALLEKKVLVALFWEKDGVISLYVIWSSVDKTCKKCNEVSITNRGLSNS